MDRESALLDGSGCLPESTASDRRGTAVTAWGQDHIFASRWCAHDLQHRVEPRPQLSQALRLMEFHLDIFLATHFKRHS